MRIETSSIEIGSSATTTRRLDGERARDRDALPLAARELVRVLRRDLRPAARARRSSSSSCTRSSTSRDGTMSWMRSGRARWWRTVFAGFSEPNGSWKIICTCER